MSGLDDVNALQEIFEQQQTTTTWHERAVQTAIEEYRAIRETDEAVLRRMAKWDVKRSYIPDSLPERISEAHADMLYGTDPVFKSAETIEIERKRSEEIKKILAKRKEAEAAQNTPPAPVPAPDATGGTNPPNPTTSPSKAPTAPPTPAPAPMPAVGPNADGDEDQEMADTDAEIPPAPESIDQENLDNIVEANDMASELHAAEVINSSEGEIWYRIYTDRGQSDYPILEWHSRAYVRPLFRGRKVVAVAFEQEIHREHVGDDWRVLRYLQFHGDGIVRNALYDGASNTLGHEIPLDSRPETEYVEPEWQHDFGMLCGRVYNKLGRDRRVGTSDYKPIKQMALSLNEATTIGHENMRLTAKKRVAVPREALSEDGTFDVSEDVLVVDQPLDDQLGKATGGGQFAVLEYSYDAVGLITHIKNAVSTMSSRCGIVAEFVESGSTEGGRSAAYSGTALRMRLIPTTLSSKGKKRPWMAVLPGVMLTLQLIDAADESMGGFGRKWNKPEEAPAVELGEPLPEDEIEETNRHVSAVGGEIESRRTAIKRMHTNWDEGQVQEELDQIKTEIKDFAPSGGGPGGPGGPGGAGGPPHKGAIPSSYGPAIPDLGA